jgi:hypothetical protein
LSVGKLQAVLGVDTIVCMAIGRMLGPGVSQAVTAEH